MSSDLLLGTYPRKGDQGLDKLLHGHVHTAWYSAAKTCKHPECCSMGKWIKNVIYLYTIRYYSNLKKEILSFMTMWMELEGVMLGG